MADQQRVVRDVQEKTRRLESLLDDFGNRLRRMRQRNRQVEEEIASFETDLDHLRQDVLDIHERGDR